MTDTEPPILSTWHKNPTGNPEKVGEGYETGQRGIVRKRFLVNGEEKQYVDKSMISEEEAKRAMQIYLELKNSGIPVPGFAKILKRKENDENAYYMAMEDITDNGKYEVIELNGISRTGRAIEASQDPFRLQRDILRTLAVMHNHRLVHFHPGLNIALRLQKDPSGLEHAVDFRVIDFTNLARDQYPIGMASLKPFSFFQESVHNLDYALSSVTTNNHARATLRDLYAQYRIEGLQMY